MCTCTCTEKNAFKIYDVQNEIQTNSIIQLHRGIA